MNPIIPFNRPFMSGGETDNLERAYRNGVLSGEGMFSKQCQKWLENTHNVPKALLTHSCSGALDMAALLIDLKPGDEVIMPSFTFVSTANSVVLRGGVPVFVDIKSATQNIDENLIEDAITPKTKAICVVHYGGVACEMDEILAIARKHNLLVIEDAAHSIGASFKRHPLGGLGDIGTLSFHETKNVSCGHGGALLIRDPDRISLANMIHNKGTDRVKFANGEVDKYTWQTLGSSFLLGELSAAILAAQFEAIDFINSKRMALWSLYHQALEPLEAKGLIKRPHIPEYCQHNAHLYYIILSSDHDRKKVLEKLKMAGIYAVFHYVPLHSSPAGKRFGRPSGNLSVTDNSAANLIRLPLWTDLKSQQVERVVKVLQNALRQ
jgi:dTDP-4-amino-4,6-dideoxygalactose transaminase